MDTALTPTSEPAARRALRAAALQAFAAHGFEGAGTRAIAQAAGTNQGLVRHHFGSKEGLWRELVERGLDALLRELNGSEASALLAEPESGGLNPHLALLQLIAHALLEPGARRDWLVRTQLEPLRRRSLARPAVVHAALPPNDVLLLSWLGAALAPALLAPALRAATGRKVALDSSTEAMPARVRSAWAAATSSRRAGPWSLAAPNAGARSAPAAGSTPDGAS